MHFHSNVSSKSKVLRSECCQQPVDVTSKQHVTATQIWPRLTKNDCLWKVEPVTRKYSFRGNKSFKTGGYNCFNLLRNRDISFLIYSNISIYLFIDTSEKLLCLQDFGKAVVRDTLTTMHVCSIKLFLIHKKSNIYWLLMWAMFTDLVTGHTNRFATMAVRLVLCSAVRLESAM